MPLAVRRAGTLGVVACSKVPADQRAVGECEPSIILEREEYETNKKIMEPRNWNKGEMKILANILEYRDVLKSVWFS
jgi:hypothetical protein